MKNSSPVYFPKTTRIKEEISEIGAKAAKELYEVKDLVPYLNDIFRKEYSEYLSKGQFFPGCPFDLYEQHYESRLQEYRKTYPDADEFDFLKEEDALFWILDGMDVEANDNFYNFYPHLYLRPHRFNLTMSIQKMHSFIDKRIEELGHHFEGPAGIDPVDYEQIPRALFELKRNSTREAAIEKPQQEKTTQKGPTSTQWALYHYVLQKSKIKPWFQEKKKEFEILGNEYGKHWNNLQTRWNVINNSNGQEGYTLKDVAVVKELLEARYPEAKSKLEELSSQLL